MTARRDRARGIGAVVTAAALALAQPSPALAGWEDEVGTLLVGMVAPSGGRGVPGLRELTTAFERATGLPTEILVARDYPALIRATAAGRIHYAVYSATAYAVAETLCGCIEPVAAPRGPGGGAGLRAALIGRQGSPSTLRALSGMRVVAGPVGAVGPQYLALTAATEAGASVLHAASSSDAERIFRSGDADALVGWQPVGEDGRAVAGEGTLARLAAEGAAAEEFVLLWSSQTFPYGPHAVRSDMPEVLKERLSRFLVNLREQQPDVYRRLEPAFDGGFAGVEAADYAAAHALVDDFAAR